MDEIVRILAAELGKDPKHIENVITLLDEGNTIPLLPGTGRKCTEPWTIPHFGHWKQDFSISGASGAQGYDKGCDRRAGKAYSGAGKIHCSSVYAGRVEDIYRPYKPKRRTRATMAREKGLTPLAELLFAQSPGHRPGAGGQSLCGCGKGVESVEDALKEPVISLLKRSATVPHCGRPFDWWYAAMESAAQ